MNIVEIKNLTKYYLSGKILGVKNLNLDIVEGEIFGFIGPNGAGKSTTIRLLLDLIRPTSGSATIFDLDSHNKTVEIKKEIGFLPGEIFLPETMSGADCLNYYKGFKTKIDEKYLKSIIDKLDLDLKKRISDYSKGNKQKLAIVLALMHKPKLLILDEPTSGLDPLNQQTFYELIKETKKWGTTTFFSTHILSEAEKICDRVGIIKAGKLLAIENIDEFKKKNIREMHIETTATIPLSELQTIKGVKKIERTTLGYHLITAGQNGNILRQLTKYDIDDFKITEPSLEEIFMHYYERGHDD
jgi:ABC-2 type transport system ATP-binding protein